MVFQDACVEHRERQNIQIVGQRVEGRMHAGEERERWSSWEFSMGSGQEEGSPLKFASPGMGLEMMGIHPDTMNVKELCFPSLLSLFHTQTS